MKYFVDNDEWGYVWSLLHQTFEAKLDFGNCSNISVSKLYLLPLKRHLNDCRD